MDQIVRKLEQGDASRRAPSDGQRREVVVQVQAETLERQRKRAVVKAGSGTRFEIYCDEGTYLGGDDSAPPPLAYFSAGIAF